MSVRSRCVSHWPHRSFLRRPLPERNSKSPFFFFFAVFLLFSFYLLSSPVPFSLRADSKLTRSEPKSSLFNVSLVRLTLTPQSNSQYIFKYNLYCECWKVYGNTAAQKRKCFLVCFLNRASKWETKSTLRHLNFFPTKTGEFFAELLEIICWIKTSLQLKTEGLWQRQNIINSWPELYVGLTIPANLHTFTQFR